MRIVSETGLVWKNVCFLMSLLLLLLTAEVICHLVRNGYGDDDWYIGRDECSCTLLEDTFICLKRLRILQDPWGIWLPSQYLYQTFPTCKGTVILPSQIYAPENTVLDYFVVEL
jgi:hypothetical protein